MYKKIQKFLSEGLWVVNSVKPHPVKDQLLKYLKIIVLAIGGFVKDHCALRASALTLYSLLSIVPIIAMLFGIAKGFGFEKKLRKQIIEHTADHDSIVMQVIEFSENLLESTKGGLVAGIGIVVLIWTIMRVIGNIESSFNDIWKLTKGRSLSRKLSDYLSLMLLAPILLIMSGSISVFVSTQLTHLLAYINFPQIGSILLVFALKFLSLLLLWTLFSFVYIFMPNTRVSLKSGIVAGIFSGTLYKIVQWAYFSLQIGVSSNNAIYGSFAAIPLFIIWLQIGWMIILWGSEVSFYFQEYDSYRNKDRYANLSFSKKKILALQVSRLIINQFSKNLNPLTMVEISTKLILPISVISPIVNELIASKIIAEINVAEDQDPVFQPACDPGLLTISYVINALEHFGNNALPDTEEFSYFAQVVDEYEKRSEDSKYNKLLKEI